MAPEGCLSCALIVQFQFHNFARVRTGGSYSMALNFLSLRENQKEDEREAMQLLQRSQRVNNYIRCHKYYYRLLECLTYNRAQAESDPKSGS
jgi:hypothetical protein